MPGTMLAGRNATCSVSAKKLSAIAVQHHAADHARAGTSSSGISLVASRMSKAKPSARLLVEAAGRRAPIRESRPRRSPRTGRGGGSRDRRRLIFTASSHSVDCSPSFGRQWNLTKVDSPLALTSRKVWTPKPSIMRSERGMARSDIAHIIMCMRLGHQRDEVPERVVRAWPPAESRGRAPSSRHGSRSGNLIASWMKNTGMLLPTRSQLPSSV